MASKRTDEIERRVNMALMAKQVADMHELLTGEDGLCKKVEKHDRAILQIKTVWTTVTVLATTGFHWLTRK